MVAAVAAMSVSLCAGRAAAQGPRGPGAGAAGVSEPPIPVITGNFSFQSTLERGTQTISPEFDPIVLVPIGRKFLVETEFHMSMDLTRDQGQWGPAVVDHGVEYLQLDYVAHPNLTVVLGRFLTPFGIYREHWHPMWIRNLAGEPIIFPMNDNSCNGAMLRGAARVTSGMQVTYAAYYSVPTNPNQFQKEVTPVFGVSIRDLAALGVADRRAGGRTSVFFPGPRLEVGVSFGRVLSDQRYDMLGADATWNLKKIPLDIRAEAIHSAILGSGYWIEGAYRLNKLARNTLLRNSAIVLRGEQYRVPKVAQILIEELPSVNTTRAAVGWNYYFHNGVRFDASYGYNFADGDNHYTWTVGLTYRFALF